MAYSKTTWDTGDKITKEKLNNMESGIANALEKPTADGTEGQILARNADGTLVYVDKPANGTNGADGADGVAGKITNVTATVDANTGTPSVQVTLGGTETERTIALAFKNLKGAKGDKGDAGATGAAGAKGDKGDKGDTGAAGAAGKNAPTITACTINVNGTTITGQLTMSEGEPISITGTYTAA